MGKFLIKKKAKRIIIQKKANIKVHKEEEEGLDFGLDYIPVATGRTSMAENLITGEWQNL